MEHHGDWDQKTCPIAVSYLADCVENIGDDGKTCEGEPPPELALEELLKDVLLRGLPRHHTLDAHIHLSVTPQKSPGVAVKRSNRACCERTVSRSIWNIYEKYTTGIPVHLSQF